MQRSMWSEACATLCDADGRIVDVSRHDEDYQTHQTIGYMHTDVKMAETSITTTAPYIPDGVTLAVVCRCGVAVAQGDVHDCVHTPAQVSTYRHGDPRFYDLLGEIAELHSSKSHDYTPAGDPLANFRRAERFGVPAWKGALVRLGDKWGRLEQLATGKDAKNESLRDTLVDMAVYSLLCVLLLEDAK